MSTLKLEANYRSDMSKSHTKAIRRQGYVTASVFGHDTEPVSVEIKLDELVHQIRESEAGMMSLIDLQIKDAPKESDGTVIIKEFFKDPLTRRVLDVQLQRVSMKEKLTVSVPIVLEGEAPGIKDGGTVEQMMDTLDVNCLPGNIPSRIEVDTSQMDVGDLIRVADLTVGGDVEVLADPDTVVVNCRPPHVAPAAEEAPEAVEGTEAEAGGTAE